MSKIVFNDGTEFENGKIYKVSWSEQIMCKLPGNDIVNATIIFGDPNKTCKMTYIDGVYKNEFLNYTIFDSLDYKKETNELEIMLSGENTSVIKGYTLPDEYVPGALANLVFNEQEEETNGQ